MKNEKIMLNKRPLLNDREIFPSGEVLQETLRESCAVFEELSAILTAQGVSLGWKYYGDSKAWLCKVSYKKKTVFWLSVWDGFFRTSFFFLQRHLDGIMALEIDSSHYILEKEWGKMIPLLFDISRREQLPDLLKMVEFKMRCK